MEENYAKTRVSKEMSVPLWLIFAVEVPRARSWLGALL